MQKGGQEYVAHMQFTFWEEWVKGVTAKWAISNIRRGLQNP